MTEGQQVALKIADFQDGLRTNPEWWDVEKRLFDDEQIQLLHLAATTGNSIKFSVEGPVRSGWSFEAKVKEGKNYFRLEAQGEQKHFDHEQSERLAQEAAGLKPYSYITIAGKSAIVSCIHDNGTFQIVYEQSRGKHIAEDAKFDGEKYVFCIAGPCGSYADNNSHYAPFVQALNRRYR